MKSSHWGKFCTIFFITLAFSFSVFSQSAPIKWGEIPKSDLEMKSYPQDTNASVLILCDFGESHFNDDLHIVFNRHQRIKIFTPKGYKWATHSVVLYTDDKVEEISKIKGATYVLDEKGEIVQTPLSENDIFEENIDGKRTRYKFTMPGLKPGCIIEIQYSIKTKNATNIRDWVFQHDEPVRWSEYQFRFPKSFAYTAFRHGFVPYTLNEMHDTIVYFIGYAGSLFGGKSHCTYMHWISENIPALREEPYVTTIDDYIQRLDIQLSGYPNILGYSTSYITKWSDLVEKFLDAEWFGKRIDVTRRVKKQAEEITVSLTSPKDKMEAIYNWVKNSIVYTKRNRSYSDQDVNDILDSKKGDNAEITFLLMSLLKSVDISCDPVILSTRDNGEIQKAYPIEAQFNFVLTRVQIDTQKYYLDATDPLRPLDLLPVKVLNTTGLVIKKDAVEWVTIASPKCFSKNSVATLTLLEDGSITGILENSYKDYGSFITRQSNTDKKDIDIAKGQFDADQLGLTIDSVKIEGKDIVFLPLRVKAWISSTSYAQVNGDIIYINPHILNRDQENPFKAEKREFPIDYAYERNQTTTIDITIPDGFEVKERVLDRKLIVGSYYVRYAREIQVNNNIIHMTSIFEVRKTKLEPDYYPRLRDLYTRMVALQSDQLVLARKKPVIDTSVKVPVEKQIKKQKR